MRLLAAALLAAFLAAPAAAFPDRQMTIVLPYSPGITVDQNTVDYLRSINPHVRWVDITERGYMTLDVDAERVQCDWWHFGVDQVESPMAVAPVHAAAWRVESGVARLTEGSGPAPDKSDAPLLAP